MRSLLCFWLALWCLEAVEASNAAKIGHLALEARAHGRQRQLVAGRARQKGVHRADTPKSRAQPHRAPAAQLVQAKRPSEHQKPGRQPAPAPAVQRPSPVAAPAPVAAPVAAAVPDSIPALYQQLLANRGRCAIQLDSNPRGYDDGDGGPIMGHYCGDDKAAPKLVYWLSNMDVDCDGAPLSGPCASDRSHSAQTAFQQVNGAYSDAQQVPYAVLNTDQFFDPSRFGIQPFAVVGVYCAGKIVYSVYGDQNSQLLMGEGSQHLAELCFGPGMTGGNGWDSDDVLYFAFTGDDAVDPFAGTDAAALDAKGRSLTARL